MVIPLLSQHDFAVCSRVYRNWRTFFIPPVWRHLKSKHWEYSDCIWGKSLYDSMEEGALRTNGHLIHSLDLKCVDKFLKDFLTHSPPTFPCLTSLAIFDVGSDELTAQLIERCSEGLKRLFILNQEDEEKIGLGPKSAEVLLRNHASTLEVVQMWGAPFFASKDIQQLLSSAPNLKEFNLFRMERQYTSIDGWLDAHDVITSEWVCTDLEVFGCQIGNIPRPDITRATDGTSAYRFVKPGPYYESIELQRGVCAQLGRLTKLERLSLGVSYREDLRESACERVRLYDCLTLTLESGLGLLRDLKQLEVILLDQMEAHIGHEGEQDWIRESWPKARDVTFDEYKTDTESDSEDN